VLLDDLDFSGLFRGNEFVNREFQFGKFLLQGVTAKIELTKNAK